MKLVLSAVVLALLVGCSKDAPPASTASTPAATPIMAKLQGMTPEQRTEYAKTHMDEIMAEAKVPIPNSKK